MPSFDRIAPFYDALARAVFGPALTRAQRWSIEQGLPPEARRILFVGGGTGAVLPALLARCPQAHIFYAEPSVAMLKRAQARVHRECPADEPRIIFHPGPHDSLPADQDRFDAVLTFFVLDLFPARQLAEVIAFLQPRTYPTARWLVADFAPPQTGWQRLLLRVMYRFFRFTAGLRTRQLPDWPTALRTAGLHPLHEARFAGGSVLAGVWQMQPLAGH